jgi:bifunctional non-homologous end joining protein LigD
LVDDYAGLVGLVQIEAVELHPWNAAVDDIEHADSLVLDSDPGEGVAKRCCTTRRLAATDSERYTVPALMAEWLGRLFIDYLRNGRGTTAVGAYSPGARPRFLAARPVS